MTQFWRMVSTNYHILNGDCLAAQWTETTLKGNVVICRECLIDGPLQAKSLPEFWKMRSAFITEAYQDKENHYEDKVVRELQQLSRLPQDSRVFLWFDHDLFCLVNMSFIVTTFLQPNPSLSVFRVMPQVHEESGIWQGFSNATAGSLECSFQQAVPFTGSDLHIMASFWNAFQNRDVATLQLLCDHTSAALPYLEKLKVPVSDFFPDDHRPSVLSQSIAALKNRFGDDFDALFECFSATEGAYGLGDLQVKRMIGDKS